MSNNALTRRSALGLAVAVPAAIAGSILTGPTPAHAAIAHPGLLHTSADFSRIAQKLAANDSRVTSGLARLTANSHSSSSWTSRQTATIIRGGTGENYPLLYNDIAAAYQNALRWKIQGSTAHGNKARDILNAWSSTLTTVTGNNDRFLAAGIYGYELANAGELMRDYPGFDRARFATMLTDIFYPICNDFLLNHNGACITNYWANWDLCVMSAILAIGVFTDSQTKINQAIAYFHNGAGNGSLAHAIPFVHTSELAQWQESGRDQGHSLMGMGLMGDFCKMAASQGHDLFAADNYRFQKAAEYVARYNLGQSVPYTTYTWGNGLQCNQLSQTVISETGRGALRPVWELLYNEYVVKRGRPSPSLTAMAAQTRAEGGGGDYGTTSGGFDNLGFGTLLHTL